MGYDERMELTRIITLKLDNLFEKNNLEIIPYGVENITSENSLLRDYLCKDMEANTYGNSLILKFAPDYILYDKNKKNVYFLEIKASKTPCWSHKRQNHIQTTWGKKYNYSNVGEMAREAHLVYKRFYPDTIILMANTYYSEILLAQYASKINCLGCAFDKDLYGCRGEKCPLIDGKYFDVGRNDKSAGSGTHSTNIDLTSMEPAISFFNKLGISLNKDILEEIKEEFKDAGVKIPIDKVDELREVKILNTCAENGSICVKEKEYYKSENINNDYFHSTEDCKYISNRFKKIKITRKEIIAGNYKPCTKCCRTKEKMFKNEADK